MKLETKDIVRSIVDQLQFQFVATQVIENGPETINKVAYPFTYTMITDNTYLLQPLRNIIIDGTQYRIVDVIHNQSIKVATVDGTDVVPDTSFITYKPKFRHGRALEVNSELIKVGLKEDEKFPLIYMPEPFWDNGYAQGSDNTKDRDSDIVLYFMTTADFKQFTIADHHQRAVDPMRNLVYDFLYVAELIKQRTGRLGRIERYNVRDHVKFGVIQDEYKKETGVFSSQLTGCELRLSLPVMKANDCQQFIISLQCLPGRIVNQDDELVQFLGSNEEYQVLEANRIRNPIPFSVPDISIVANPIQ